MDNNRGGFSTNIGFILAAVGSAIGMGNLWGFPYKMGANGGFPFLVIYLVFVITCGVIVIGVEMAIGRKTGKSPILAMAQIGEKYKFIGAMGVACSVIISGFYSLLIGYGLRYMVGFGMQIFGADGFAGTADGAEFFGAFTGNVGAVILYTFIVMLGGFLIVAGGVSGGIEKFNKIGVPALFCILIAIIIYNFTLPGSGQGYTYMFTSKGMEMAGTEFNFFNACRVAAGQMLFSCSLGMGIMITYGSYLDKDSNISKNAWVIPAADTLAAIMAGMAIFPAVFAQGGDPKGGVGLLFMTMQNTFASMGYVGNIVGFLFYVLVLFAGISSLISLMEVSTSHYIDKRELRGETVNRKKATGVMAALIFALSIPVAIDQLGGSAITQLPLVRTIGCLLDTYDFFTEGIMMPLASILMCLIIGYVAKLDWLDDEMERGGAKFYSKKFFHVCLKVVTPLMMCFVLISLALSYIGM